MIFYELLFISLELKFL